MRPLLEKLKALVAWLREHLKSTDRQEIEAWEKDVLGGLDEGDGKR